MADYIKEERGIDVDPKSMFDIQIKRIHEYKRQLMAALHVATLYNRLKENPDLDIAPRTVIFGGKPLRVMQWRNFTSSLSTALVRK